MDNENNKLLNINEIKDQEVQFKKIMLMYRSALKEIETKVNIISDEFQMLYSYNPIEHIKTRIKSPASIVKKLKKKGYSVTYTNLIENLNDVAGIRIVCSFIPDIYKIVEMFDNLSDITIVEKKDYIKHPKESGYSSFHLIALVPVSFSSGTVKVKVEIQIRTIAMDFWASLEHKIKYKYFESLPVEILAELKECSQMVGILDNKMSRLGNTLMQELDKDLESGKNIEKLETKPLEGNLSINEIIERI